MNTLEKEFIPYQESLELKELGFDEPCFGRFYTKQKCKMFSVDEKGRYYQIKNTPKKLYTVGEYFVLNDDNAITAPTFSQAFRWFREKYGLYHSIGLDNSLENDVNCDYQIINHSQSISEHETNFNNYEEAELACLNKLIEIVKNK